MESVKLYRESFSSGVKKQVIVFMVLLLLILWFSFRNNKPLLRIPLLMIFSLILVYTFVSFFVSMKRKVAVKNDKILVPGTAYLNINEENTNRYTLLFRKSHLKRILFQFNKSNIKKAYKVSGKEKEKFDNDEKLNFWDEEYIEIFQVVDSDKAVCVEFKQPLRFKPSSEWGVQSGGTLVFINFPKREYPLIKKIYFSVEKPEELVNYITEMVNFHTFSYHF